MDPATLAGASVLLGLAYAGLMLLFHLYFAYGLQMIADRQDEPELARVLAWIPGLQIYAFVRCGGGSFGRFLLLFVGGGACALALGALGPASGLGLLAAGPLLWAFGLFAYLLALQWRIAERQGLPGAFSLLLLLPVVNLVAWWAIAYRDGLEPVHKLGLALGLLVLLVSLAPAGLMAGAGGPLALAMAQGGAPSAGPGASSEVLAELGRTLERRGRSASRHLPAALRGEDGPAEPFGPAYRPETGVCPPGSRRHGARPPRGLEQWCAREGSGGRLRHGWSVRWHENGVRAEQGSYRDGERSGTWTRWYESGQRRVEARFRDGEQDGLMRRWSRYGRPTSEVLYRDGEPIGAPPS